MTVTKNITELIAAAATKGELSLETSIGYDSRTLIVALLGGDGIRVCQTEIDLPGDDFLDAFEVEELADDAMDAAQWDYCHGLCWGVDDGPGRDGNKWSTFRHEAVPF